MADLHGSKSEPRLRVRPGDVARIEGMVEQMRREGKSGPMPSFPVGLLDCPTCGRVRHVTAHDERRPLNAYRVYVECHPCRSSDETENRFVALRYGPSPGLWEVTFRRQYEEGYRGRISITSPPTVDNPFICEDCAHHTAFEVEGWPMGTERRDGGYVTTFRAMLVCRCGATYSTAATAYGVAD